MKETEKTSESEKSKAGLLATVLVGLVLVGGNVFFASGFFAMKDAAADFYNEIQKKDDIISKYENKTGIPRETIGSTEVTQNQPEEAPVIEEQEEVIESEEPVTISSEYIYFPEYGVKLKKSSDIVGLSYRYQIASGNRVYVYFWGTKRGYQYYPNFANPAINPSGIYAISIAKQGEERAMNDGPVVYEDDNVYITATHPQSVFSQSSEEVTYETESVQAIEDWLKGSGAFSRI